MIPSGSCLKCYFPTYLLSPYSTCTPNSYSVGWEKPGSVFFFQASQVTLFFFFHFFFQRLFIFRTERDRAWTGEGQRERETQNRKQAPGSEPSAQSSTRGSNSRTVRSWPGWSRTLNRLRHPGAPPGDSYVQSHLGNLMTKLFIMNGPNQKSRVVFTEAQPFAGQEDDDCFALLKNYWL